MAPENLKESEVVLVVDDDPDFCLAMRYMLEAHGYDVAVASNGMEALSFLAKQKVSVVMTDLYMPRMDGLEFIRRLRKDHEQPIVVVTGDTHLAVETTTAAAAALGADAVLIKPFNRAELLSALVTAREKNRPPRPPS
ncbi:MAG: response regulator [Gemmatimonadetes bacterium]|nr:response regulator [Gemmatimonadota bacterium]